MASSSSAAAPPERSIFGWDPRDETASIVGDWIWRYGRGVADLEVRCRWQEEREAQEMGEGPYTGHGRSVAAVEDRCSSQRGL
jgi:hypothetical protein